MATQGNEGIGLVAVVIGVAASWLYQAWERRRNAENGMRPALARTLRGVLVAFVMIYVAFLVLLGAANLLT